MHRMTFSKSSKQIYFIFQKNPHELYIEQIEIKLNNF